MKRTKNWHSKKENIAEKCLYASRINLLIFRSWNHWFDFICFSISRNQIAPKIFKWWLRCAKRSVFYLILTVDFVMLSSATKYHWNTSSFSPYSSNATDFHMFVTQIDSLTSSTRPNFLALPISPLKLTCDWIYKLGVSVCVCALTGSIILFSLLFFVLFEWFGRWLDFIFRTRAQKKRRNKSIFKWKTKLVQTYVLMIPLSVDWNRFPTTSQSTGSRRCEYASYVSVSAL